MDPLTETSIYTRGLGDNNLIKRGENQIRVNAANPGAARRGLGLPVTPPSGT